MSDSAFRLAGSEAEIGDSPPGQRGAVNSKGNIEIMHFPQKLFTISSLKKRFTHFLLLGQQKSMEKNHHRNPSHISIPGFPCRSL